jgi:hypothetical protein
MNTYSGNGGIAVLILNLGTRWKWVISIHAPAAWPPEKNPRFGLDALEMSEIPCPYRDSNPGASSP